jgi:hypothetical protein
MMLNPISGGLLVGLVACALSGGIVVAEEWPDDLESFFKSRCFDCHGENLTEGGLNLRNLSRDLTEAKRVHYWTLIHDRINAREMPPKQAEQPSDAAREKAVESLAALLTEADRATREVGLRRLNRSEYENTVRDLFGIYVDSSRLLPDDEVEQGFDTTGSALSLSAEQMVLYVEAADLVLDQVFGPPQKPKMINKTVNFATTPRGAGSSERKLPDGVVLFSGAKHLPLYDMSLPEPGLYRVRVKVRAEQSQSPVVMHVLGGNTGSIAAHTAGFFEALPGKVTTVEFTDRSPERSDCFAFGLIGGFPWWSVNVDEYKGPGLFIGDIEIEGPIEPWPPLSRAKLLGDVDPAKGSLDDVQAILLRIVPQAFRRATNAADVQPYVALARQALDEDLSFEAALRRGLKGILCAPEFLFLEESFNRVPGTHANGSGPRASGSGSRVSDSPTDARPDGHAVKRIDDYALASRLSYFFWSSLPDDELVALAKHEQLNKPAVLRAQVERMLDDPKSDRFVMSFAGQWLRLRDIDFTVPNQLLYPEYSQLLRQSMLDETHAFFREILERDHSVQNFVDSDFVMINQPLAEFYGIEGVKGLNIRRVDLPRDSVRGGVLTQASVLKVSADGTRTSPVLRGVWILKHLFGTPSPPPPPAVAAVEPDIRGATTIREQLAKHRDHESCNRCHRKIDPPGFALESFDVIGAQRDWYRTREGGKFVKRLLHPQAPNQTVRYRQGLDVDSSGTMPDGRKFSDIREYKRLLLEDETAMASALTRLLLTYSLGRQLGFSDRPEVEKIVGNVKAKNYGLRSIIHEVVQSDAFR